MICSLLFLLNYGDLMKIKKVIYNKPPDIERLLFVNSSKWYEVKKENQESVKALDAYDIVKSKIYRDDAGHIVQLLITWSSDGLARSGHLQQYCYNAHGSQILKDSIGSIIIGKKRLLYTAFMSKKTEGQIENVIYWRVTGGKVDDNYTTSRIIKGGYMNNLNEIRRIFLVVLNKKVPDNIMIRISNTIIDSNQNSNINYEFLRDYLNGLSENDLKIVMGN
jgi:hypothetical protein